jgi:hypothetical protein
LNSTTHVLTIKNEERSLFLDLDYVVVSQWDGFKDDGYKLSASGSSATIIGSVPTSIRPGSSAQTNGHSPTADP